MFSFQEKLTLCFMQKLFSQSILYLKTRKLEFQSRRNTEIVNQKQIETVTNFQSCKT